MQLQQEGQRLDSMNDFLVARAVRHRQGTCGRQWRQLQEQETFLIALGSS